MMKSSSRSSNSEIALILAAAGSSTRMGGEIKKEYLPLEGGTVLSKSLSALLDAVEFSCIVVTVQKNGAEEAGRILFSDKSIESKLNGTELHFVEGGSTRQESIFRALDFLSKKEAVPGFVMIHDGARPFVSSEIIKDTLSSALLHGAAVPGITPTDTQKVVGADGFIKKHLERASLSAVQTPQCFVFKKLLDAHMKARKKKREFTDDAEIYGIFAGDVKIVRGSAENIKITYAKDYRNSGGEKNMKMRCGLGYDIHRLEEGRRLLLGAVEIPFDRGEAGHSDGDVLLHAITDALLGASALGDIGSYFPSEDARWKDSDSAVLLKTCWNDVRKAGWKLQNLDCVVKLEKPKFLPYRTQVVESIAKILEVEPERIFVKAKTGEKLGDVGEGRSVEAFANCLLSK